jgi:hypothetical protein
VNGSSVSKSVSFLELYAVTFTETGLPSGTTWYVNLSNGQSFTSSTNNITFTKTNGTYSYKIATLDKTYEPLQSSGSFTVNGSSVSKSVSFLEVKYTVTFTETGLPSGTTWYVNLSNGQSFSSANSTISFSEPNGTYSYTISNVSGYSVLLSSGSITVSGAGISKTISFTPVKKSSPASGISSIDLYGIIGAVIAVAVIGSVLAITRKRK